MQNFPLQAVSTLPLLTLTSYFFQQHRTTGDEPPGEGWLALPMEGDNLVKEVRERTVLSKEEQRELLETEDVKVLGDLSDQVSHGCQTRRSRSIYICIL
jgi:hypothetical protein